MKQIVTIMANAILDNLFLFGMYINTIYVYFKIYLFTINYITIKAFLKASGRCKLSR